MALATDILKWPDIPCFGHTLQLCVVAGLDNSTLNRLLAAARKLVGHFKHSPLAMGFLKEKQRAMNIPEHKLIQDVNTRWNSSFFMLERLLEQRWAIYGVLHDDRISKPDYKRLDLKEEQWELISDLIVALRPLQVATTALCNENNVSISSIYPIVNGLLKKHLVISSDDNHAVKVFKEIVSTHLRKRFNPDSVNIAEEPAALATALDPRYHQIKFFSDEQRSFTHRKLCELASDVQSQKENEAGQLEVEEPHCKKARKDTTDATAIEFLLEESSGEVKSISPQDEVDIFLKEPPVTPNTNPLHWWKQNSHRFPYLSEVAKRVLCIPATSVPSERIFSKSGLVVNKQRASLKPSNVDMIVFLNKNLPKTKRQLGN